MLLLPDNALGLVPTFVHVRHVEPGLEDSEIVKDFAHDEVEKRPKLVQVVLKRRARQEQLVGTRVRLQFANQFAVGILQP